MMTRSKNDGSRKSPDAITRLGPALAIVAMLLVMAFALFLLPRL